MRKTGLNEIFSLAKSNSSIIFIGSDLGYQTLEDFKNERPSQFLMEGISEANIVSMAAGLAQEGYRPYINTIATFFTRRAFEQIALDIYAENLNVTIYGNGGGLVYGPLGHSHTAVDDFALFYPLSGMTVLAPADAYEMSSFIKQSEKYNGPVYIRLGKGGEEVVTNTTEPKIGKASFFELGEATDSLICTTGVMLQRSLEIAKEIKNCDILHFSTLQPFDDEELLKRVQEYKRIIIIEEHLENGGLGTRVMTHLFRHKVAIEYKHFNLGSDYISDYGRQEELFEFIGIDPDSIIKSLK